jgi:hypothetical protein
MCEWIPPGEDLLPRSLELTHEANPWTVDLHGSFERDFGGAHRVLVVPSRPEVTEHWSFGGRPARVLAQPYLSAYLAAHASQELKNLTLIRLIELVLVLRRGAAAGTLRWDELMTMLGPRAARFVYPAFELAERLAPGTVDPGFRVDLQRSATPRVRRVVGALEPATAQRLEAVSLGEQFMWVDGPMAVARRLARVLWPEWAGSLADMLRVQRVRLRQLLARRVMLTWPPKRPYDLLRRSASESPPPPNTATPAATAKSTPNDVASNRRPPP